MRTLPVYSTSEFAGSSVWKPAVESISVALEARPWCWVVLMTVTVTCEGATGFASTFGHGMSPVSAYLTLTEKSLPNGTGTIPVNTRAAATAATIIAMPMIANVVFWRC